MSSVRSRHPARRTRPALVVTFRVDLGRCSRSGDRPVTDVGCGRASRRSAIDDTLCSLVATEQPSARQHRAWCGRGRRRPSRARPLHPSIRRSTSSPVAEPSARSMATGTAHRSHWSRLTTATRRHDCRDDLVLGRPDCDGRLPDVKSRNAATAGPGAASATPMASRRRGPDEVGAGGWSRRDGTRGPRRASASRRSPSGGPRSGRSGATGVVAGLGVAARRAPYADGSSRRPWRRLVDLAAEQLRSSRPDGSYVAASVGRRAARSGGASPRR